MEKIKALVDRLVVKTPRVITNITISSAEFYICLLAECNAGKRITCSQRGLFQRRCYVAGLQHSRGHSWELGPYKTLADISPGRTHKMLIKREMQRREAVKQRRLDNPSKKLNKRQSKILRPYSKNSSFFATSLQVYSKKKNGTELQCKRLHKEKVVKYKIITDKVVLHQLILEWFAGGKIQRLVRLLYKSNIVKPAMKYGIHNEYIDSKRFEAKIRR
ncbi:hypothetical protein PR048_018657 [Dryococelus australis]|uniref:Uncharacterized protein n=1 Tax=Dryococelus australis TaxID=614101 RepID=A0ABQ9HD30_9NEOP|nr:hypothetical protein PR048_018657 [Dryococelus australis]